MEEAVALAKEAGLNEKALEADLAASAGTAAGLAEACRSAQLFSIRLIIFIRLSVCSHAHMRMSIFAGFLLRKLSCIQHRRSVSDGCGPSTEPYHCFDCHARPDGFWAILKYNLYNVFSVGDVCDGRYCNVQEGAWAAGRCSGGGD